jgi:hypothetical protein
MVDQHLFSLPVLVFLGGMAVLAFLAGVTLRRKRGDRYERFCSLEAAFLTLLGGSLAHAFIGLLLLAASDVRDASFAVGWAFFLWPGIVDTLARFWGEQWLCQPEILLWLAAVIGAFRGMYDGMWSIATWPGGGPAFILDVTWGLSGTTNGVVLQSLNVPVGEHGCDHRSGCHRYVNGVKFKEGFAVTMGSVMSNMRDRGPEHELFRHERTHVWQNRLFGPIYTLTYVGWMVVLALPGAIAGLISGEGAAAGAEQWGYYNNPWEAWAYNVGSGPRSERGPLVWSDRTVIFACIPFFAVVLAAAGWLIWLGWGRA